MLKHRLEHWPRQFASEGVLLAGVIRAYQRHPVRQNHRGTMAKPRPRFGYYPTIFFMSRKKRVESDLAQCDDNTDGFEQLELLNEVWPAALEFNSARFIVRRRAPNSGANVTIRQFQAVISMNGVRLIGESGGMKRSVEPVTAAIPGKYSAGPISPVRRRRQADNQ